MTRRTRIIGIDLGTTNSCVSIWQDGAPRVLPSPEGLRTTPSVVAFPVDKPLLVGAAARRQMVTNPARTFFGTKRLIGLKVSSSFVEKLAQAAPFEIVAAANGDAWVRMSERDVSPQELSSYVLERMRFVAEEALGEPVTQAVVTVPAYFNDAQRQATKDAARLAGLDVRRILNEPTAAALAYGVHRNKDRRRIAVFDLGGGTFDVSVMSVQNGMFEVLAVSGDPALGGDDFDNAVAGWLRAELEQKSGVQLGGDPVALGRLKEEAEKAKIALSQESSARVHLPYLATNGAGQPVHLERVVTRAELESVVAGLLDRLEAPCRSALADAGLAAEELDEVLLVGGMTRMPSVQERVERIFRRKPSKGANPDEVVAQGAALHAAILEGLVDDAVLLDVTPHALGIRLGEGGFSVVIPRNTTVPAKMRKVFATSSDDQSYVKVEVYQGESTDVRLNRHLGRFSLDGLPKGPAGSIKIELVFRVDADGIVSVHARELSTGMGAALTITPSGGLSEEDMEAILEAKRRPR